MFIKYYTPPRHESHIVGIDICCERMGIDFEQFRFSRSGYVYIERGELESIPVSYCPFCGEKVERVQVAKGAKIVLEED